MENDLTGTQWREAYAIGEFGLLIVYWGAVARLTLWDYGCQVDICTYAPVLATLEFLFRIDGDAMMGPITYLSGLSTVICVICSM